MGLFFNLSADIDGGFEAVDGKGQVRFDLAWPMVAPLTGELPPRTNQFDHLVTPAIPHSELPPRDAFGAWLIAQHGRKGWIGDLAKAAKADREFPKDGSPDDVRNRLHALGVEGDVFEALDDAELDWVCI